MRRLIPLLVLALAVSVFSAEEPVYFADPNLKAAVEEHLGISDPNAADMNCLTVLNASDRRITDLTGLEYAANLTRLNLTCNEISDIQAISALSNLAYIDLGYNQISDVSPIEGLMTLSELNLYGNNISDISAVVNLTNLLELSLRENQLDDNDICLIAELTTLVDLELGSNNITDVSCLSSLTNLTRLDLWNNQISNMLPLSNLINLEALWLGSNPLSTIFPVSLLPNLRYLALNQNNIFDISPVSGLVHLENLHLGANQICDISPIANMSKMVTLNLAQNHITDISPLAGLTNLQRLFLHYNNITDISAVSGLTNLWQLWVGANNISDISALSALTGLTSLSLHSNPLDTAAYCTYLPLIKQSNPDLGEFLDYDPNPYPLVGDCHEDCQVDLFDLAVLANYWHQYDCGDCEGANLNSDDGVGYPDLQILVDHWLEGTTRFMQCSLDEDPTWTAEGQWEYGQPIGWGGIEYGYSDPYSGFTGTNVYGVNLYGDYAIDIGGPYYLIAGPFDCSRFRDIRLRFARWLNTDEAMYVTSTVDVSDDTVSWTGIWNHRARAAITDGNWRWVEYDLGDVADYKETVYIRWGYEVFEYAYPYSGWNIDDVELWGNP
jgi:internalin A